MSIGCLVCASANHSKYYSIYEAMANFDTSAYLGYPSRNYVPLKVKVFSNFLQQHLSGEYFKY